MTRWRFSSLVRLAWFKSARSKAEVNDLVIDFWNRLSLGVTKHEQYKPLIAVKLKLFSLLAPWHCSGTRVKLPILAHFLVFRSLRATQHCVCGWCFTINVYYLVFVAKSWNLLRYPLLMYKVFLGTSVVVEGILVYYWPKSTRWNKQRKFLYLNKHQLWIGMNDLNCCLTAFCSRPSQLAKTIKESSNKAARQKRAD